MNITGGASLSLFEVQEAAAIVASASDEDVNIIFGSVINDDLKDEIVVTVIATDFNEAAVVPDPRQMMRPGLNQTARPQQVQQSPQPVQQPVQEETATTSNNTMSEDTYEIPAFLRNRKNRR